jgi:hypothetical protein
MGAQRHTQRHNGAMYIRHVTSVVCGAGAGEEGGGGVQALRPVDTGGWCGVWRGYVFCKGQIFSFVFTVRLYFFS